MKEIGSFINLKKEVPPNKPSHLKEGVMPIVACLGEPEQFKQTDLQLYKQIFNAWNGNSHNIDFYGGSIYYNKKAKHHGENTYIISPVDNLDKFSNSYYDCTGIIVTGQDKKTVKIFLFKAIKIQSIF